MQVLFASMHIVFDVSHLFEAKKGDDNYFIDMQKKMDDLIIIDIQEETYKEKVKGKIQVDDPCQEQYAKPPIDYQIEEEITHDLPNEWKYI